MREQQHTSGSQEATMNPIRYRVVVVHDDGHREIRASNLGRETADAVRDAAIKSGRFVRVAVERHVVKEPILTHQPGWATR
jgi:hypothetical protein